MVITTVSVVTMQKDQFSPLLSYDMMTFAQKQYLIEYHNTSKVAGCVTFLSPMSSQKANGDTFAWKDIQVRVLQINCSEGTGIPVGHALVT